LPRLILDSTAVAAVVGAEEEGTGAAVAVAAVTGAAGLVGQEAATAAVALEAVMAVERVEEGRVVADPVPTRAK
jgi:hypothetical protein